MGRNHELDARFWDDVAEGYAKKPVSDLAAYERKLVITKSFLSPTDVVLDIGCGTGSLALELAPLVSEVHALDFSIEMIEIGKRKAREGDVHNITFHQTTLEGSNAFSPQQFDGICAYNILHLVGDRPGTLKLIDTYLKPGGFFVSSTAVLAESMIPFRPILAAMRFFGKAPPVGIFKAKQLLREIENAGFVDIATPEVGAKKTIGFVTAKKPA